jgi:hypothetical protein
MAIATSLPAAAGQAFDNLHVRWQANQLRTNLSLFCEQTLVIFPQSAPDSNPVSNWITVLWALSSQLAATNVPIVQLTQAAEIVYRLCWMASALFGHGVDFVQQATLLAKYNVFIGF